MNKFIVTGILILLGIAGIVTYQRMYPSQPSTPPLSTQNGVRLQTDTEIPLASVVAEDFDTPWAFVFLPDMSLLVTERPGRVVSISEAGERKTIATVPNVREIGEGGLLGIALHPDFETNHLVYFYYTYNSNENATQNRVVRMTYENNTLTNEQILIDAIPGAANHNGGKIAFGPDDYLYITTGDAGNPSQAQNTDSLSGKILRVTDEGKPAPGNPFQNMVYSYGHRNPQGLTWDNQGRLWATEHGRSGVQSGFDEVNLIIAGGNYGWPDIQGDDTRQGMTAPVIHSGATTTWAPGNIIFAEETLFFTGLRGSALYAFKPQQDQEVSEFFKDEFGRLRGIEIGPDGMIYITTSNNDGRGQPRQGDDKIIKINPARL